MNYNSETSSADPLKYKMDKTVLIVSICKGKSIIIRRVDKTMCIALARLTIVQTVEIIVFSKPTPHTKKKLYSLNCQTFNYHQILTRFFENLVR